MQDIKFFTSCKVCNKSIHYRMPYCSAECINNDEYFHEICRTAYSVKDAARKFNMPDTSFRRLIKQLNITIEPKKREAPVIVKVCPRCSKEHTAKYGTYCSRSCANKRPHTEETKHKISTMLTERFKENREQFANFLKSAAQTKSTETKEKISNTLKNFYKDKKKSPEEHAAKNRYSVMKYLAKKKAAIASDSDHNLIRAIYKNVPQGYEVDHIIPLSKGGLHHQDNLQYLDSLENKKKGDRLDYVAEKVIDWRTVVSLTNKE